MTRTGRPREFDTSAAIEKARDVFWTSGYHGTSVQDLVDAVAVERGSLYAAFGDKRQIYLKAVALYWAQYERTLDAALSSDPLLPALRDVLVMPAQLGAVAHQKDVPHGCMMGNTAVELAPFDDNATHTVRDAFRRFTDRTAAALGRAQERGEVTTSSTPEAQAQLILVVAEGTALLARTGTDPDIAVAAIDAAILGLSVV